MLEKKIQSDVDVLKIDVPDDATTLTGWKITRLARSGYYFKDLENLDAQSRLNDGKTRIKVDKESLDPDSDIYALAIDKIVSITPLSIDFSSTLRYFKKNNARNINYMAVLVFSKCLDLRKNVYSLTIY